MQPNPNSLISFDVCHSPELGAEPVIDRDAFSILEELADEDDPDLVSELIDLFLDDSAMRTESIDSSHGANPDAVGAAAHALKSASANIGALPLSAACAELESVARGSADGDLEAVIDQVLAMYTEVRGVLNGNGA